jgi:hypothetical protein
MWFACITYLKLGLDAFTKWKLLVYNKSINKSIGLGLLEFGAEFSAIVVVLHNCQNWYYIRVPISFMFNHIYIYIYIYNLPQTCSKASSFGCRFEWLIRWERRFNSWWYICYHTIAKVGLCVKSPQFHLGNFKRFYYVVLMGTLFKLKKFSRTETVPLWKQ